MRYHRRARIVMTYLSCVFLTVATCTPSPAVTADGGGPGVQRCSGASGWTIVVPGGAGNCGSCTLEVSTRTLGTCVNAQDPNATCNVGSYPTVSTKYYACRTLTDIETVACWGSIIDCWGSAGAFTTACGVLCGPQTLGLGCLNCIAALGLASGGCSCITGAACCDCVYQTTSAGTNVPGCV
jgi:hypothetical protein